LTELMQAHRQWMSRTPDERFTSLIDMQAFKRRLRDNSRSQVISSRGLTVRPVEDDARALQIMGRRQRPSSGGADALVVRAAVFARQPRKFAGKGQAIELPDEEEDEPTPVPDLMAALERSLEEAKA